MTTSNSEIIERRGPLPLCGMYRNWGKQLDEPFDQRQFAEWLDWFDFSVGQRSTLTAHPDVLFKPTDFFCISDSEHDLIVESIQVSNIGVILNSGSMPVEAFPCVIEKENLKRLMRIDYPLCGVANRIAVVVKNIGSKSRHMKAWFEGTYSYDY